MNGVVGGALGWNASHVALGVIHNSFFWRRIFPAEALFFKLDPGVDMTQTFALSNAHVRRHIPSGKLMIRKEAWTEDGAILFDALTTPGSSIYRSPTLCEEK